jgi:hypothetical protein
MGYDTYLWGEAQAADGLTALAAIGPTPITFSGDKNKVRNIGNPELFGLGSLSDTKPQGCAITPELTNGNNKIYGPGAIDFFNKGFMDFRKPPFQPKKLSGGEMLEGFISSTAVNEGGLVAAHIAYNGVPGLPTGGYRYSDILSEYCTITTTTALTVFDGKVNLKEAITRKNWLNVEKDYDILGVAGCIGAATFGGVMQLTGLGGDDWAGRVPGILINPLSAVDFSPGNAHAAPEPIPFSGKSLPDVSMCATSLGAMTFVLIIGVK